MSMITQALAEFDEPKAAIAIVRQYANLTLAADGIGKVQEAHKQVKRLRIDIDSRRKSLNEGALTYQRTVNAEAKRLTAEIEPIEAALWSQRQIHEAAELERQTIKHAAKRAALMARIEKLAQAGCIAGDVAAIEQMNDDEFQLHFLSEQRKAEMIRAEQEAARLEVDRREAERFAEIERQAEEMRVRAAEIAADRKAIDAERKSLEIQQAELDRQHEAIRFNEERKAESERQAALLIRRQEDERLASIAADLEKAARIARLEALRPEIEKAETFANRLIIHAVEILRVMGEPSWSVDAMESVRRCGLEVLMIARGEGGAL